MAESLRPPRGTYDLIGTSFNLHHALVETVRNITMRHGFEGITTPIFEYTPVFLKPLGDTSDIVGKEMYTFEDKGGESITLRPEGTAAVVRSIISNGMTQSLPLKLAYTGPMFRYERPQKGRFRQHHQYGVEYIGVQNPLCDAEVIHMAHLVFEALGASNKVMLQLNTLGSKEDRAAYKEKLLAYLTPLKDSLSRDSQDRLTTNPLRILDSKDPRDQDITAHAPKLHDSLCADSKIYFDTVCNLLDRLNVPFETNQRMVRGLDYYTHTAFEFVASDIGAKGTVLGGGRYDGLVRAMGGPDLPGIGWAFGIERMLSVAHPHMEHTSFLAVVALHEKDETTALALAQTLRAKGFVVHNTYTGNAGKRLKYASKVGAAAAILVGHEDASTGFVVRDLQRGDQVTYPCKDSLLQALEGLLYEASGTQSPS